MRLGLQERWLFRFFKEYNFPYLISLRIIQKNLNLKMKQKERIKVNTRLENEEKLKCKAYVDFYKNIIDQDRCAVVICNLEHEIIYMNPAAIENYSKRGGEKLLGQNLMDCHNTVSQEKIRQVVEWFAESPEHKLVYTFYNEKQNKDVYMVALRSEGKLIGYYEKHEFRNRETMKPYDLW